MTERQDRKTAEWNQHFDAIHERQARGDYRAGDVVNGYVLTRNGEWQTLKRPFTNAANALSVLSLLCLTPLSLVAFILAVVGQSKDEPGANKAMVFAAVAMIIGIVIFMVVVGNAMSETPTYSDY